LETINAHSNAAAYPKAQKILFDTLFLSDPKLNSGTIVYKKVGKNKREEAQNCCVPIRYCFAILLAGDYIWALLEK
jgi:hypothetical protein